MANHQRIHDKARRQVLEALDLELAKLKSIISLTDMAIATINVRNSQMEELHRIRHERLALFDEDTGPGYRLQIPACTWNLSE